MVNRNSNSNSNNFSVMNHSIIKNEYKVVKCKTEHGEHYEIWENGNPQYRECNTKFGKRMMTDKWKSYRIACRALQNRHYNNNPDFVKCFLGINY
jgi:hypothetical protein